MKKQSKEPQFSGEFEDSGTSEEETPKKKNTLIANVSDTQYDVVKFVAKKIFKWKLQYEQETNNWDIFWTDAAVSPETLGKMQPYQKINHFPGMFSLARKNHLGRHLMKLRKQFPEDYKFFPQTWLLPAEYNDFKNQFQKGKARTFIIKPEASCQGRGIFLTRNINDVTPNDHCVAQRYMHRPFLIDGLKFDLRVYVLLAGTDPLRIYVYQDGLVRFATEQYVSPTSNNLEDMCMHLTNYAINKENSNFIFNQDASKMDVGHKRSIKSVFSKLAEQGHDIPKLWAEMNQIFIKTFTAVQPILSHHYRSCQPDNYANNICFEILGFDIYLNHKLTPFLIEVNHTPSFTTDTPLDALIKKNLIRDTLRLMNVTAKAKEQIIASRKESLQQRVLTGKKIKLTPDEKAHHCQIQGQLRDEHENAHLGDFIKIYPLEGADKFDKYIEYAAQIQDSWTGTNIKRNVKKVPEKPPLPTLKPQTPSNLPKLPQKAESCHRVVGEDESSRIIKIIKPTKSQNQVLKKPRQSSEPPIVRMRQPKQAQNQMVPKPCLQPKLFEMDILENEKKTIQKKQYK